MNELDGITIGAKNMKEKEIQYKYIKEDPLKLKIDYSYSEYRGIDFIKEWEQSRITCLSEISIEDNFSISENVAEFNNENSLTEQTLNKWILSTNLHFRELAQIALLLKRFEVVRKLYNEYDENFRPLIKTNYNNTNLYVKFGFLLNGLYEKSNRKQYLNSILKVNDILISIYINEKSSIANERGFAWLLKQEIYHVKFLIHTLKINQI